MAGPARASGSGWYVPVRDAIAPANRGDAVRHGVVRAAFLSALVRDGRVLALFKDWGERTDLLPRMHALQAALHALGGHAQLPPGTWADAVADALPAPPTPGTALDQALAAVRGADRALCGRLAVLRRDQPLLEMFKWDAIAFVGALGTPWPWLGAELLTGFVLWVSAARIYEGHHVQRVTTGLWPAGQALPRGKFPDKDVPALRRYAVWFYRVKIRGEPVLAVARDHYGEEKAMERRKDVREGVQRAESLLALGQYRFAPGVV